MKITPLIASRFLSDGGAMFGLVPKPIWSKQIPADARNRIRQNANVLLVELDDGRRGLVDSGCGDPAALSDKERDLQGMDLAWPLRDALQQRALDPADIAFVVLTHLHGDHAGGLYDSEGAPGFPNAELYLHALEFEDALSGDPLLHKSYPPAVTVPLNQQRGLHLIQEDDAELFPGLRLVRTGGHTRGHCAVHFHEVEIDHEAAQQRVPHAVFAGDVCPTHHHTRLVFQTAYDTFPLDTRAWKQRELQAACASGAHLLFCHDPDFFGGQLEEGEKGGYILKSPLAIDS